MFDTCTKMELCDLLGQFHVPMFAAQRDAPGQAFRLLCVNPAHERTAGLPCSAADGALLEDVLPADEAMRAAARYEICATTQKDLRYREILTWPNGAKEWETQLQYVPVKSGGERIIGVTFELEEQVPLPVFDDVKFHALLAGHQLQNITSLLEKANEGDLFCTDNTNRIGRLGALCRGVQQALDDIAHLVEDAEALAYPISLKKPAPTHARQKPVGSKTVEALCGAATRTKG